MSRTLFRSLGLLGAMLLAQVNAPCQTPEKRVGFSIPSAPWTMTLPANDFNVKQEQLRPDGGGGYFYLVDEKQHLNLSFFIEPVGKCRNSKACRDMVWKAGNPAWENPQNIVMSEIGDVSVFEFLIPSVMGRPVQQQHMYAQFVVDGFWVDLHFSKVQYKPQDRELFERVIKAVRFEPKKKVN